MHKYKVELLASAWEDLDEIADIIEIYHISDGRRDYPSLFYIMQ